MADPERILIVRPSALGDVCRTVPVLATLRRAWPDAALHWVVQTEFAAAIAAHPALDEAVEFPRHELGRWWRSPTAAAKLVRWLGDLRRRRYDIVYDFQGLGRSGLFTRVTGAPRRVGLRSARELAWLGYTVRHPDPTGRHTVERMLHILVADGLEPVYDMRLYARDEDRAWWSGHRGDAGVSDRYAVLAPTARWLSKRWPAACWAELLGPLRERGFEHVVIIGAPGERDQTEPLRAAGDEGLVDLTGETTVGRTMAIIAEAGLVVANDSAPLHMAVGFERPYVGLFGPTDPEAVGPWGAAGASGAVVRAPAADEHGRTHYKDTRLGDTLMRRITREAVLAAIDRVGATSAKATGGAA